MEKRYIFDADTHVSPYSNFDKSINACQWEERMERAGVAHAIVWLLPQGVVDVTESNRYIGREAQKNKRMVPFGWANIREGAEKAREEKGKPWRKDKYNPPSVHRKEGPSRAF